MQLEVSQGLDMDIPHPIQELRLLLDSAMLGTVTPPTSVITHLNGPQPQTLILAG